MVHGLSSDKLSVLVSTKGAELISIKNQADEEQLWQADPKVWPRHAPVLFPIVGKLKNNLYFFEDKQYNLGQHGFARDKEFRVIKQSKNELIFELTEDAESLMVYPFQFKLQISYSLKGSILITAYSLNNPAPKELYFSVGAHPGFKLKKEEDYYLEFEKSDFTLTTLKNGLISNTRNKIRLTGNKLSIEQDLFLNDALVFENAQISRVSLCSVQKGTILTLDCEGWPFFGIWSKMTESKKPEFLCLEPWYGIADSELHGGQIKTKKGIMVLPSGGVFNAAFRLSLA